MATREQLKPTPVFNSTTGQSMSSSLLSLVSTIPGISILSYDVSWVGSSPVGLISIQGSNTAQFDGQGNYISGSGNWFTVPFQNSSGSLVTSLPVSGSPGSLAIGVSTFPFTFIQLVYTATSGSGTISAVVSGKVA